MIKYFITVFLFPLIALSQVQIGSDLNGLGSNDFFGTSVSISASGNIIAVGSLRSTNGIRSGAVSVYENVNSNWIQIGNDIDGVNAGDFSGYSISLSANGNVIAIGAPFNGNNGYQAGQVRVFENISGNWVQKGNDIYGTNGDQSGSSVALSTNGNIISIGAKSGNGNGNFTGQVKIYEFISGSWSAIGNDIFGESFADYSGASISMTSSGDIVAIGAPNNDGNGVDSGHVRIFQKINNSWLQVGNDIDGEFSNDYSGYSISISSNGSRIAVGAIGNDALGTHTGHVRIYENLSGVWTQIGNDIDGESYGDESGWSVSLSSSGSIVAIGAVGNDNNGSDSGQVKIYNYLNGIWTQVGIDINGEFSGDNSGQSVSLSKNGKVVVIGAARNDGNGTDSGHVRVFDLTAVLSTDSKDLFNFKLYPNPTHDQFEVILNDNIHLQKITIYNTQGEKILTTFKTKINISNFSSGFYLVEVITNLGKQVKKIIIK